MKRLTSKALKPAFGVMVRTERNARSDGLRKAAAGMNIGHSTLGRVENGYMPDVPTLARICRHYGIDPKKALDLLVG